jgi:hypothetical protein
MGAGRNALMDTGKPPINVQARSISRVGLFSMILRSQL